MASETYVCTLCSTQSIKSMVEFGRHPPSNRFLDKEKLQEKEPSFKISLGYCPCCQTAQLSDRMPKQAVKPVYSWLLYNEPEGHLDDVASRLHQLPGLHRNSQMLGISYKDQSTFDRLATLGLPESKCLSQKEFNIFQDPPINYALDKHERVKLVLARHVIEHTEDPITLMRDMMLLLEDEGYLVIEIPDSERIFKAQNYGFIWEEHISYFTENSMSLLAEKIGARLLWCHRYHYDYEDSLVAVFQHSKQKTSFASIQRNSISIETLLNDFADNFLKTKSYWHEKAKSHRAKNEKLAVFGAGHLGVKFINFFGLADYLDCVIDDNPHKTGMYMPGSKLPIVPSSSLLEREIKVCFSTLSPESEKKVKGKLPDFFDKGGLLIPAFQVIKQHGV